MSKVTKTEATKQKQHTQHRIIVNFHPLPFRTIVVCMGVRTLHLSCHLASVIAPCIFLVCLSDGRTGSLFEFVCAVRTLISASSLLGVLPLHHVGYRPTGITISGSVGDIGGSKTGIILSD